MKKKKTKRTLINRNQAIFEQSINVKFYDENSILILEIEELNDGSENWRKEYKYSEIQDIETLLVKDEIIQTNEITKNTLKQKLKEVTINNNQIIYTWNFDEVKNQITEKEYNIDGELLLVTIKHLNTEGQVTKEIEGTDYQTNYKYVNGKVSNVQIIDNGQLVLNEDYFYDKKGNEIRSLGIDYEEGSEIEIKKVYNENDKPIREEQFLNGNLEFKKHFEYDSTSNLVRMESINLFEEETEIIEIEYGI